MTIDEIFEQIERRIAERIGQVRHAEIVADELAQVKAVVAIAQEASIELKRRTELYEGHGGSELSRRLEITLAKLTEEQSK